MTTVRQLITHLETLPQEAIVEVLEEDNTGYYVTTSMKDLDTNYTYVMDFTSDVYKDSHPKIYGKIFVQLNA